MARLARVVAPDMPHHITQRGNRRQQVFFKESDYELYLEILADKTKKYDVDIWCYCLMPNHVHLIGTPKKPESLSKAIGEAHKEYTRYINKRENWTGYLWQGRFSSFVMDEKYFLASCKYIENNPVKAKMVKNVFDYKWSSANAHKKREDDILCRVAPALSYIENWEKFLTEPDDYKDDIEKHSRTGRPLGNKEFIKILGDKLGLDLMPKKAGRKPKEK